MLDTPLDERELIDKKHRRRHRVDHLQCRPHAAFGFTHERLEHAGNVEANERQSEDGRNRLGAKALAGAGRADQGDALGRLDAELTGVVREGLGTLADPGLEQIEATDVCHVLRGHQLEDFGTLDDFGLDRRDHGGEIIFVHRRQLPAMGDECARQRVLEFHLGHATAERNDALAGLVVELRALVLVGDRGDEVVVGLLELGHGRRLEVEDRHIVLELHGKLERHGHHEDEALLALREETHVILQKLDHAGVALRQMLVDIHHGVDGLLMAADRVVVRVGDRLHRVEGVEHVVGRGFRVRVVHVVDAPAGNDGPVEVRELRLLGQGPGLEGLHHAIRLAGASGDHADGGI